MMRDIKRRTNVEISRMHRDSCAPQDQSADMIPTATTLFRADLLKSAIEQLGALLEYGD